MFKKMCYVLRKSIKRNALRSWRKYLKLLEQKDARKNVNRTFVQVGAEMVEPRQSPSVADLEKQSRRSETKSTFGSTRDEKMVATSFGGLLRQMGRIFLGKSAQPTFDCQHSCQMVESKRGQKFSFMDGIH